jgi:hypothetical protein
MNPWAIAAIIWLLIQFPAATLIGRWLRRSRQAAEAPTKPPNNRARDRMEGQPPPPPGHQRPRRVRYQVTHYECGCSEILGRHSKPIARFLCEKGTHFARWEHEMEST